MPQQDELSSSSKHVEAAQNDRTLDTPSPVQIWTVPEAQQWMIEEGDSAVMEAETTADNSGPAGANDDPALGSQFGLAYREKDAPMNQWQVFAIWTIDAFNQLSIAKQQDGRASDRRLIEFDDRAIDEGVDTLTFDPDDQIGLVTNCDDEIDADATYFNYDMTVYRN
ncbi:hypothetical protein [Halorussus litoreus]|uniref:hypothetical protein n=1 Tax=Halorussus litoreus TaxID=1710536 RepID=UPI000E25387F|nr:hypothetical protein [Halorussus litoreus]